MLSAPQGVASAGAVRTWLAGAWSRARLFSTLTGYQRCDSFRLKRVARMPPGVFFFFFFFFFFSSFFFFFFVFFFFWCVAFFFFFLWFFFFFVFFFFCCVFFFFFLAGVFCFFFFCVGFFLFFLFFLFCVDGFAIFFWGLLLCRARETTRVMALGRVILRRPHRRLRAARPARTGRTVGSLHVASCCLVVAYDGRELAVFRSL